MGNFTVDEHDTHTVKSLERPLKKLLYLLRILVVRHFALRGALTNDCIYRLCVYLGSKCHFLEVFSIVLAEARFDIALVVFKHSADFVYGRGNRGTGR